MATDQKPLPQDASQQTQEEEAALTLSTLTIKVEVKEEEKPSGESSPVSDPPLPEEGGLLADAERQEKWDALLDFKGFSLLPLGVRIDLLNDRNTDCVLDPRSRVLVRGLRQILYNHCILAVGRDTMEE